MKLDKNGKPKLAATFAEQDWGLSARGWAQLAARLSSEQWTAIIDEVTSRGGLNAQEEAEAEEATEIDSRGLIDLWYCLLLR